MRRIGIDFDNTMVCYDRVFHTAAVEMELIPASVAVNKIAVRDFLRAQGGEDDWIALQGEVYGKRMQAAEPFPGMIAFVQQAKAADLSLCIVSHKTRHPFKGPHSDLHEAARAWIHRHLGDGLISDELVYFELTKEAKLARIDNCDCETFIDDLPEILTAAAFPEHTNALLFDPANHFQDDARYLRLQSWCGIAAHLDRTRVHA